MRSPWQRRTRNSMKAAPAPVSAPPASCTSARIPCTSARIPCTPLYSLYRTPLHMSLHPYKPICTINAYFCRLVIPIVAIPIVAIPIMTSPSWHPHPHHPHRGIAIPFRRDVGGPTCLGDEVRRKVHSASCRGPGSQLTLGVLGCDVPWLSYRSPLVDRAGCFDVIMGCEVPLQPSIYSSAGRAHCGPMWSHVVPRGPTWSHVVRSRACRFT